MANRRRIQRRQPRVSSFASTCLVYEMNEDGSKGELKGSIEPKAKPHSIEVGERENGKLFLKTKERALR